MVDNLVTTTGSFDDGQKNNTSNLVANSSWISEEDSLVLLTSNHAVERGEGHHDDQTFRHINAALDTIGMGSWQYSLFLLCGFGWVADNMWIQAIVTILPRVQQEFDLSDSIAGLIISAIFIGMFVGAGFWGVASDRRGRKPAFTYTLLLGGLFGGMAALSPSYPLLCVLVAAIGFAVGGNLPIDSALFLEFIPQKNRSLLTLMSLFWPVGQVITSILAWILLTHFSCHSADGARLPCSAYDNMGWRYELFALGSISFTMLAFRALFFHMYESPKFLVSVNRRKECVDVLHALAKRNGVALDLTVSDLHDINTTHSSEYRDDFLTCASMWGWEQIKPLFATPVLACTTALLWTISSLVLMGYTMFNGFLPKYLRWGELYALSMNGRKIYVPKSNSSQSGSRTTSISIDETYRNYMMISMFGIPGSILGSILVDGKLGRRGTMALATAGTAISMHLFTIFSTEAGQLICSCFASFLQNIMYGVLYAYTPEVFPTRIRGTAVGIGACISRIFGLVTPVITGMLFELDISYPLHVAYLLLMIAALLMILLPIETRDRVISHPI